MLLFGLGPPATYSSQLSNSQILWFVGFLVVHRSRVITSAWRRWRCRLPWRSWCRCSGCCWCCWRCRGCGRWMWRNTSIIGTMGPCRRASTSRRLSRKRNPFPLFFWSNHFFASEYATSTKSYAVLRRSSPACFANLALLPGCTIRSKARFLRSISLDSRPRIAIQSNLCFLSLMAKILSTSFTRNFLPLMLISSSVSA